VIGKRSYPEAFHAPAHLLCGVYQTTLAQSVDLPLSACQRAAKTRSGIAWGTVADRQEWPGDLVFPHIAARLPAVAFE
jgi:hypothetical protein